MSNTEAREAALALINRATIAMLGNNSGQGYPHIKAMLKMENEGLQTVWFSTNTSSKRVSQLERDPKTCVYMVDMDSWEGLMLVGQVELLTDDISKQRLWRTGYERYYPLGVTDPDYTVLRFKADWGNYYHALNNVTFELP